MAANVSRPSDAGSGTVTGAPTVSELLVGFFETLWPSSNHRAACARLAPLFVRGTKLIPMLPNEPVAVKMYSATSTSPPSDGIGVGAVLRAASLPVLLQWVGLRPIS